MFTKLAEPRCFESSINHDGAFSPKRLQQSLGEWSSRVGWLVVQKFAVGDRSVGVENVVRPLKWNYLVRSGARIEGQGRREGFEVKEMNRKLDLPELSRNGGIVKPCRGPNRLHDPGLQRRQAVKILRNLRD